MAEERLLIVVGVDGSDCGAVALHWAERYAALIGGTLILVTAWQWPRSYGEPIRLDDHDPGAEARAVAEKVAEECTLSADRITTRVEQGAAGDVLVRASEEAGLLVVGTRGHGGLVGAILGSTSSHCVHHARCSVVVAR